MTLSPATMGTSGKEKLQCVMWFLFNVSLTKAFMFRDPRMTHKPLIPSPI